LADQAAQDDKDSNTDLPSRGDLEPMSATYGPSSSTDAIKRVDLSSTMSSSVLFGSRSTRAPANSAWKKGVADRNTLTRGPPASSSMSSETSESVSGNRLEPDFPEDEPLMRTLMPGRAIGSSSIGGKSSSVIRSQGMLRPSATPSSDVFYDDEDDDDDEFMDMEDAEYLEDALLSHAKLAASSSSPASGLATSPSSPPSSISRLGTSPPSPLPGSLKALLGPPPTTAAISPPVSAASSSSSPPSQAYFSPMPSVPSPPPNPGWFGGPEMTGGAPFAFPPHEPSPPPIQPSSVKTSVVRKTRARAGNAAHRLTYVGTDEDLGILRRAELARLPMPNFRKDYHVSILIQYTDNSKDVLEYKNRVHPECCGSDIINECVLKTKKKLPNWNAPADRFTAFELILPAKNDEDDDIIMDLDTPVWKYCFVPGEVTRLVLRLKMRFDSNRIVLKIRTDRGPLRTMTFHTITPISIVIEKIQHKIKSAEKRGPPFTGLFVFDNKRGRFLENTNKTLADYRVRNMDIIQVKRRRLMELCLKDQPNKNLMIPLDLTASLLAEQLHDWLRLDPVDPSILSLVKVVPKRGSVAEMQLVLNANTEVRGFHLVKEDIILLRKRILKLDPKAMTNQSASASSPCSHLLSSSSPSNINSTLASSTPHQQQQQQSPASSTKLGGTPTLAQQEARLAKSGSHQVYSPSDPSSPNGLASSGHSPHSSYHASIRLPGPIITNSPFVSLSPSSASPSNTTADPLGSRSHVADTMGTVIATFQVAFAGNTHDSESFGSGISMKDAFRAGRTRRFPPPKLKIGEVGLFQTVYGIYMWDSSIRESMLGDVHITNYRLVFSSYSEDNMSDYLIDVPLTTIARVEKTVEKSKPGLKVDCKDFRTLRFHFDRSAKDSRRQMRRLLEDCLYPNFKHLFALAYKSSRPSDPSKPDGWKILDLKSEFLRLGVGSGDKGARWRISSMNETYAFSKTYPSLIAVPTSISDDELVPVFKYRSKGRLPALSWLNSRTGASITRCSQPLSGMTKKTSLDDANLINAIKEAQGSADAKLHLLDARPRANAIANMAMGGGFEVLSGSAYSGCDLEFLNIGNIHVMRNSLSDLKSLLESQPYDNSFLARLEASGWLLHISLILQGATKIVEHIQARHSCALHCSDGWDRTSQLSSVAMLLLDPYYRTIRGLCLLIEKEWCSFGHKFASRYGHIAVDHVDKNYAHGERAPIFLQFIDCVYQIIRQFPLAFEFNENALLFILEHLYSCHYGTFLFDCERERKIEDVAIKTESIWTYILDPDNADKFKNIFYEPFDSVLPLAPTLADVHLWRTYYRRWYAPPEEDKLNMEDKIKTLVSSHARQADRIAQLELRLSALERKQPLNS